MPMNGTFDASQIAPKQAGTTHPIGKFPAKVSATSIEPIKSGDGGMFIVEFTTPAGQTVMRYNLWNPSEVAVRIAQGQLSALCHATGVFKLDWQNDGAALINANCQIEVVDQLDKEKKPTGYTQISKVYDANGNEPGKPSQQPTVAPQQGQQWGGQQANPQPAANPQPSPSPAWGNQNANGATAGQPGNGNPGWQAGPNVAASGPGGTSGAAPPWANR